MAFGSSPGADAGVYAEWVAALRRWSSDPATPLDALPQITEDSFDRDTFDRLIAHVTKEIDAFMRRWSGELQKTFARAPSAKDLGTELLRLRRMLEPRVRLARAPGWPPQVRDALWDAFAADVQRIQADLESTLARSSARGRFDRASADAYVDAARKNPLTGVLTGAATAQQRVEPTAIPAVDAGPAARGAAAPDGLPAAPPPGVLAPHGRRPILMPLSPTDNGAPRA